MKAIMALLFILLVFFFVSCEKTTKPDKLPVVTISLPNGNYLPDTEILMTCNFDDALIRYTTDSSEPDESSAQYTAPLMVSDIIAPYTNAGTLKASAFRTGWFPGLTTVRNYSVTYENTVTAPVITPDPDSLEYGDVVSLSTLTPDAQIRYTLDGSEPDMFSSLYIRPFSINQIGFVTLQARAFCQFWNPSVITTISFSIPHPAPEMVSVEGGTFSNGTSNVTLSSFLIDKTEVTQNEYFTVMGAVPPALEQVRGTYPVYYVSWFNAIEYCNRRSILDGLTPCYSYADYGTDPSQWPTEELNAWNTMFGQVNLHCDWSASGYRLPTEMEWMFAARGGNLSQNYLYSGDDEVEIVAWYEVNSNHSVQSVATKQPNELGIFDTSGNLWEWCWDVYADYPSGDQTNPTGPAAGNKSRRVIRGGSWYSDSLSCQVSYRNLGNPIQDEAGSIGFRCCKRVE